MTTRTPATMEIEIMVNGDARHVPENSTVTALLVSLGIQGERVAVEVNGDVIRREARDRRTIAAGDAVEIVSFVGGGA